MLPLCEYVFTSLYPCILKFVHIFHKHLKNADVSLSRETDHCVGVTCFMFFCRQVFYISSFFFLSFFSFTRWAHSIEILAFWTACKYNLLFLLRLVVYQDIPFITTFCWCMLASFFPLVLFMPCLKDWF